MAVSFTIYTWYDPKSPVQQANFRRWNRTISSGKEKFDVIVFYSDEIPKESIEKYVNLRFWRLHANLANFPASLLNEAIRYSRAGILVYVSPWVLVRKVDLYCMANRVRKDYAMAWTGLKRRFLRSHKNFVINFLYYIRWILNTGRLEFYAHLNSPFDFYDCGFFSFNRIALAEIFKGLDTDEKRGLLKGDHKSGGSLNFYFFHILQKNNVQVYNEGRLRSYSCIQKSPPVFYSYLSTIRLIQMSVNEKSFHYKLNIYRVFLPVMQLTQVALLGLVWFYPVKSLSLAGFYLVLSSGVLVEIFFNKKTYSAFMFPIWFFAWLFV